MLLFHVQMSQKGGWLQAAQEGCGCHLLMQGRVLTHVTLLFTGQQARVPLRVEGGRANGQRPSLPLYPLLRPEDECK